MSKVRLKQIAQDGATNGQAIVWNNTTGRYEAGDVAAGLAGDQPVVRGHQSVLFQTTADSAWEDVPFDITLLENDPLVVKLEVNNTDFTALDAGLYEITWTGIAKGSAGNGFYIRCAVDVGAGPVVISEHDVGSNNGLMIGDSGTAITESFTAHLDLNAGDIINIQFLADSAVAIDRQLIESAVSVLRCTGAKGDAGPAGGGDVTGPASSVNNRFAFFSAETGKVLKDHSDLTYANAGILTNAGTAATMRMKEKAAAAANAASFGDWWVKVVGGVEFPSFNDDLGAHRELHGEHAGGDVTGKESLTIGTDKVVEAKILNGAVSLAKLKAQTVGDMIAFGAAGAPVIIAPDVAGYVLQTISTSGPPLFGQVGVAGIADNVVSLAKMTHAAGSVPGALLYDATGVPILLAAPATVGLPLVGKGVAADPAFEKMPVGSIDAGAEADGRIPKVAGGAVVWGDDDSAAGGGGNNFGLGEWAWVAGTGDPAGGQFTTSGATKGFVSWIKFHFTAADPSAAAYATSLLNFFSVGDMVHLQKSLAPTTDAGHFTVTGVSTFAGGVQLFVTANVNGKVNPDFSAQSYTLLREAGAPGAYYIEDDTGGSTVTSAVYLLVPNALKFSSWIPGDYLVSFNCDLSQSVSEIATLAFGFDFATAIAGTERRFQHVAGQPLPVTIQKSVAIPSAGSILTVLAKSPTAILTFGQWQWSMVQLKAR